MAYGWVLHCFNKRKDKDNYCLVKQKKNNIKTNTQGFIDVFKTLKVLKKLKIRISIST